MSTTQPPRSLPPRVSDGRASDGSRRSGDALTLERDAWQQRSRVVLTPIAAPSVLGFYAFAVACSAVMAHLVGWFGAAGSSTRAEWIAAIAGGLLQVLAAAVAFRARDGVATAAHGAWGAFFVGFGVLGLLATPAEALLIGTDHVPELGLWLIIVAGISLVAAVAALAQTAAFAGLLIVVGAGAGLLGAAEIAGSTTLAKTGAWVLLGGSGLAFYVASALLLATTATITSPLPLGRTRRPSDVDGNPVVALGFELGEPGVRRGQ